MRKYLDRVIAWAGANPAIFNTVRRVLEGDFLAEKRVIREELCSLPGPRRVLDVGCGTGYFASLFDPRTYVGMDLSWRFVAYARRTHAGYTFCQEDARHVSFADRTYDDALVLGILHHLRDEDARAVMAEVGRVLRPGGRVLVMEDAHHDQSTLPHEHEMGELAHLGVQLFQWADVGDFIRTGLAYAPLFGTGFEIERTFTMHSGVCYYQSFVLRRAP